MTILTNNERLTLDDAEQILRKYTVKDASWQFYLSWWDFQDKPGNMSTSYFSPSGVHHPGICGETFADRVQAVLNIQAAENPEQVRLARIAALEKELAELSALV